MIDYIIAGVKTSVVMALSLIVGAEMPPDMNLSNIGITLGDLIVIAGIITSSMVIGGKYASSKRDIEELKSSHEKTNKTLESIQKSNDDEHDARRDLLIVLNQIKDKQDSNYEKTSDRIKLVEERSQDHETRVRSLEKSSICPIVIKGNDA